MNKKSKIFIIIFFSLILIPVIAIGIINYTKEQELKNAVSFEEVLKREGLTFDDLQDKN